MRNTLSDNIKKLTRVTEAIERLSNPGIYYLGTYRPQRICDNTNKRLLKQAMKSMRRLTVVIQKQSTEEMQKMFPHFGLNLK